MEFYLFLKEALENWTNFDDNQLRALFMMTKTELWMCRRPDGAGGGVRCPRPKHPGGPVVDFPLMIHLAGVAPNTSLTDLISDALNDKRPGLKCSGCFSVDERQIERTITGAPEILLIQLLRFVNGEKIYTKINYGMDLHLNKHQEKRYRNSNRLKYRLASVVMHWGTFEGGHYCAYV